ncbi:MAG: hypothetical protein PUF75_09305 [Coprococcus sp.]|nr:hypothetical protein [Coprococcus sp.]
MGEENKNVKKPAVSNAVVKKRPAGTGTKSTGNTRPGNGTKNTGSARSNSGTRSTNGTRPSNGTKNTSSTRPGSGTSAGSAHSNRIGSGVKNTAARSNGGSARNTNARSNNASGRKPQPQKRRRRRITANQFTLLLAVVVGIILLFVVNGIMRGRYLKVKQISSEYVLGSKFDITAYVEPVNSKAVVTCDTADFAPEKIGSYKVSYIVKCGKLKKKKKLTLEVVDRDFPEIIGPDNLGVFVNEQVDLLDYYSVEDSQPDLTNELTINRQIDTTKTGDLDCTLRVTDWSNNSSSKDITVTVYGFEGDMKNAALAIRAYNRDKGYAVSDNGVYVYYPDKDKKTANVLINNSILYEVSDDCSSKEMDENDELVQTIINEGTWISIDNLGDFNYLK